MVCRYQSRSPQLPSVIQIIRKDTGFHFQAFYLLTTSCSSLRIQLRGHFLQKNSLSAWEASLSFCNLFISPKEAGEQDSMRQAIMHDCNNLYAKWFQSCPTLCDPLCSSVHGILQARIREWVAISYSRGSPFALH